MKKLFSSIIITCSIITASSCEMATPEANITEINVQRIFGECRANVPKFEVPIKNPDGECEIITQLLDSFEKENPDIKLNINIASWPGYDQLSAQFAAGDPPDIVTMHISAMPDYQARSLILPLNKDFANIGISDKDFTNAARNGVTIGGEIYGLPFDNWTQLWHINTELFAKAGLMEGEEPILPKSPKELIEQAKKFKAATGLPYLIQATANEQASFTRNLYIYLMDQDAQFFANPNNIEINNAKSYAILELFRSFYANELMTQNQDYPAATQAFLNGKGGVYQVGTWMIGTFGAEAKTQGQALYNSYTVRPYPMLFGKTQRAYVDGHAWVKTNRKRSDLQNQAVNRLLKFLYENNYEWSRTGHLPTVKSVAEGQKYLGLPYRKYIAQLSQIGTSLPQGVQRQFAVSDIIGDEMFSAITGIKSPEQAMARAEARVNDLLFHLAKPNQLETKNDTK